jgi:23S rRNA pseudouridine1911/1915/1917 synthase
MEPTIIFEDDALFVVGKPAGMVVNKSDTTRHFVTLQDWAEKYVDVVSRANGSVDTLGSLDTIEAFYDRAGIAHRLDKETSGILLIAKQPQPFFNLLRQFRERTVHKAYTALVHGKVQPKNGEIKAPVGRQEWNRKRFGVVAGGREAVTRYEVLGYYADGHEIYSLLRLYPETGRTHQIRVHLKYINHPIVSDDLYGGRKTARNDRKKLERLFLHASNIAFLHPVSGEEVRFQMSLSPDLQQFIEKLERIDETVDLR